MAPRVRDGRSADILLFPDGVRLGCYRRRRRGIGGMVPPTRHRGKSQARIMPPQTVSDEDSITCRLLLVRTCIIHGNEVRVACVLSRNRDGRTVRGFG